MKDSEAKNPQLDPAWWGPRASKEAKGQGVEMGLEMWKRCCSDSSKFTEEAHFTTALDVTAEMEAAIKKADKKCGGILQKSTKLCLKNYSGMVAKYRKKMLEDYTKFKAAKKKEDEQEQAEQESESEREEFSAKSQQAVKQHLGLTWPFEEAAFKSAWKKFNLKYHPDRNPTADPDILKGVSSAYAELKKNYDWT